MSLARCAVLAAVVLSGLRPAAGVPEHGASRSAAHQAVDGDTILMASGERLRLVSVDCPETGRPGAEQARQLIQAFLDHAGPGPLILDPPRAERDRYGRILADLRVQGQSVSRALLQAGLGWVYRSHDPGLVEVQSRAVHSRRGVHAVLDHPVSAGPYVLTSGSFHRPGCSALGGRAASLPWSHSAADPLAEGKAPCRRCLAWPPTPPFEAHGMVGKPARDRLLPGG